MIVCYTAVRQPRTNHSEDPMPFVGILWGYDVSGDTRKATKLNPAKAQCTVVTTDEAERLCLNRPKGRTKTPDEPSTTRVDS